MAPYGVGKPELVGDSAVTVRIAAATPRETLERVRTTAAALEAAAIPGTTDVVGSPGLVTVVYDPLAIADCDRLVQTVTDVVQQAGTAAVTCRLHEIPVAYDGPDLDAVCATRRLDRRTFVAAHCGPDYVVEAIGFLPGFGYLAGLPSPLATPRQATPRIRVPAGSVGIGGGQTGVYPFASPGGWNLVGRTQVALFDPTASRPAALAVGDRVRFAVTDLPPALPAAFAPRCPMIQPRASITVEKPGLFTTIQDLGRPGYRGSGVPLSGAADPLSLQLANLLVGNDASAAALECTLVGPTLRFDRAVVVAVAGATFPGLPPARARHLPAGTVLELGHATVGCRGYLAIAGGIDVDPVLGSRSTLVVAGFGGGAGRALLTGDRLAVGSLDGYSAPALDRLRRTAVPVAALRTVSDGSGPCMVRVIPAPARDACDRSVWSRTFRVSSRSDRMGVRLDGLPVAAPAADGPSVAVGPGTVQLPPDGRPIILLADAQTIGGYPVIGQVITADLPMVAQLRPGDAIGWCIVDRKEAHAAHRARIDALASLGNSR